jgi:hypothetical protein
MAWRRVCGVLGFAALLLGAFAHDAAGQPRDRPIRVGNTNLLFAGGGYSAHDHPTFDSNGFVNLAYQRRILRREVRIVPVWVRGAVNFLSEERELTDTYTYWPDAEPGGPTIPFPDPIIEERTSDFSVRVEALADLLHTRTSALYAGTGFVVHSVYFRSRGSVSRGTGLSTTENRLAYSAVVGGRLFMATKPYTAYAEVRFGRTFGRAEGRQDVSPPSAPSINEFELDSVANMSFEGGLALHW